jgi:hypothetical protein
MGLGIVTQYLPVTRCKGSRIKAVGLSTSVTVPYDNRGSEYDAHKRGAEALQEKAGEKGKLIGAYVSTTKKSMSGKYVFILIGEA